MGIKMCLSLYKVYVCAIYPHLPREALNSSRPRHTARLSAKEHQGYGHQAVSVPGKHTVE